MIQGTVLKNGVIKLILTGTDSIDEAILKELNGATCKIITENFRLGDKSITGGIIIEKAEYKRPEVKQDTTDLIDNNPKM